MEDPKFKESKFEEFTTNSKKIYRTNYNKVFCGVANGFAEYFEIDVKIIRIFLLFSAIFLPFLLVLYIISAFMLPIKEKHQK
jgi:phage shock protein C